MTYTVPSGTLNPTIPYRVRRPNKFIERLGRYLEKWRKRPVFNKSMRALRFHPEGSILLDEQRLQLSTANVTEGKGKLSLEVMAKVANDYYEAHNYPTDNHEHRDKKHFVMLRM